MIPHTTPQQPKQATLFFNTTKAPEAEVKQANLRAKSQNKQVLQFFESFPGVKFTPIQVFTYLYKDNKKILLTSVRRAITSLTKMEMLIKDCNFKKKEIYGDSNCTWSLHPDYKKKDSQPTHS